MPLNPLYDVVFDCNAYGLNNLPYRGVLNVGVDLSGEWVGIGIVCDSLDLDLSLEGVLIESVAFNGTIDMPGLTLSADFIPVNPYINWVKWSDIGNLDFTLNRKGVSGQAPMPFAGEVYQIRVLDKYVIVYGSGGVARLASSEAVWGVKEISSIGLKSRYAVVSGDSFHLYIGSDNELYKVSDKIEKLGYKEFMSQLTSPIMSIDIVKNFVYVCDGSKGFVYNVNENSMASGPVNVTGIQYYKGTSYVMSSGTIAQTAFNISSDILDIATRANKTLREIEVGTNLTGALQVGVDFSMSNTSVFVSSPWFPLTPNGIGYINCFGKEFKIKIKSATVQSFEIDYIKLRGVIHDMRVEEFSAGGTE